MENLENQIYAGSAKRGFAIFIDIIVAGILRIILAEILGRLWFNQQIINFYTELKEKFDTDYVSQDSEQISFLMQHSVLKSAVIFYLAILLVGAFYHAFLNSSSWMATVGKRVMNIMLIKDTGRGLTFWEALGHYFLSLVPWVFMFYLLAFQAYHQVSIYHAIANNTVNLVLGIVTIAWIQIHIITKKKTTAGDMICKTVMVQGRIGKGWLRFRKK